MLSLIGAAGDHINTSLAKQIHIGAWGGQFDIVYVLYLLAEGFGVRRFATSLWDFFQGYTKVY